LALVKRTIFALDHGVPVSAENDLSACRDHLLSDLDLRAGLSARNLVNVAHFCQVYKCLTVGRAADLFDRSIDIRISRLRRKIEQDPKNPKIITTVRSGGYFFAAEGAVS